MPNSDRPPARPRTPLSRDLIIDAAIKLVGREGPDGLSMRRLAKELRVEAMSLYNHVANKADLVEAMTERVYDGIDPGDSALAWQQRVRAIGVSMYRTLRRNPSVPHMLATRGVRPTSTRLLAPLEHLLEALHDGGFAPAEARRAALAVNAVTLGALWMAGAGRTDAGTKPATPSPPRRTLPREASTAYPHVTALLASAGDSDPEADYLAVLDLLIAGMAQGRDA